MPTPLALRLRLLTLRTSGSRLKETSRPPSPPRFSKTSTSSLQLTALAPRSPGGKDNGSPGYTGFLAALTNSRRLRDSAATHIPYRPAGAQITAGTRACLSGWRATTCAPGSSGSRKTTSSWRVDSSSTSRAEGAKEQRGYPTIKVVSSLKEPSEESV